LTTGRPVEAGSIDELRRNDVQVFSSPSDAPRVRRTTDLVSIVVNTLLLIALVSVAGDGTELDDNVLAFVRTLPGPMLWLAQAAYAIAIVYAIVLLFGVGIVASRRLGLFRDLLLAATLSIGIAVVLTRAIDGVWPQVALFDLQQTRHTFPAFAVTAAVAIQSAASPYLTTQVRHLGWALVGAAPLLSVLGGVSTISDTIGGVLVGLLAAAVIRRAVGTTAGLPSTGRLRRGLRDLGLDVATLEYRPRQIGATLLLVGTTADGTGLFVNVLGSDSWNSRQLSRWWRIAWYRDRGEQFASDRRQQVEHEALALLSAAAKGAPVPGLLAVGVTANEDAILATTSCDITLADLEDDIDGATLAAVWSALLSVHGAGLSHGTIDARHIWFSAERQVQIAGFSAAALNPSGEQRRADLASLFVVSALLVGNDRAIAAATAALGRDGLATMLPMVQAGSLSTELREDVKRADLKMKALRNEAADSLGIEVPEPVQLTRVTWWNLAMVVFIGFAVYTIVGGLADVGWSTIVDTLADARWGLVLLALAFAQATNYTDAVALTVVSPRPVPVGITTIQQFAIGFVNVAVPSAAGRVATNARYFQKFGVSPVTSTMLGVITSFLGFISQMVLMVLTVLVGDGSIDLSNLQTSGNVLRLVAMAVVIAVLAILVVAVVPPFRHWAMDQLRTPFGQLREAFTVVKSPRVAAKALGASMVSELLYGAGFAMCVLAMGGSITLGEAVFINVAVSLFAGLMPIPGGVGVTEAGLTAGLAAIGVPSEIAVGAVIVWRLVSFYLPPTWGYVSMRWLIRHDYL
jgi:glycosyltransferase 2 family protein